jgi:hypothetical protein
MVTNKIMWCRACSDARLAENENKYCSVCSDKLIEIGWINNEEM